MSLTAVLCSDDNEIIQKRKLSKENKRFLY